jgi:hypothetical protein
MAIRIFVESQWVPVVSEVWNNANVPVDSDVVDGVIRWSKVHWT